MKIRIVTAHPRTDSLTMSVTNWFIEGATTVGHTYELFNLYQQKFNPVLYTEDEPEWENPSKVYSDEVMTEVAKIKESDALIFIFPVWWYSVPAIMKGYLDRVMNYGVAYGGGQGPVVDKIRWIALAGLSEATYNERNHNRTMEHHLNFGIADYIGVEDSKVHFIYKTLAETGEYGIVEDKDIITSIVEEAYRIGKNL